jgi:hypothetical protein
MKQFRVEVTRTRVQSAWVTVEAMDEDEAYEKAPGVAEANDDRLLWSDGETEGAIDAGSVLTMDEALATVAKYGAWKGLL